MDAKENILKANYERVFSTQKYDSKCSSKGVCDLFALPAMEEYSTIRVIEVLEGLNFNIDSANIKDSITVMKAIDIKISELKKLLPDNPDDIPFDKMGYGK